MFLDYEWRGNVRELEKTVKRMVVLAEDGDTLGAELLPPEMREQAAPLPQAPVGKSLRSNVSMLERRMIEEALERRQAEPLHQGVQVLLGIQPWDDTVHDPANDLAGERGA